jgi:WD40 repeat protein
VKGRWCLSLGASWGALAIGAAACRAGQPPAQGRTAAGSRSAAPEAAAPWTTLDGFAAEGRGDWAGALHAYEVAAGTSPRPWIALALGARVSAQRGDRENARRLFDAAARELEAREGKVAATELAPNARGDERTEAFAWLSPRRVAVATSRTVSVLDANEDQVEYAAETGLPADWIHEGDLLALTHRLPLLAIRHREKPCVRLWDYLNGQDIACVPATFEGFNWLALAPQGAVLWGHAGLFSVAGPDRPPVRLDGLNADTASESATSKGGCCRVDSRLVFSPDGTRLAAGSRCSQICVWESASGALRSHIDLGATTNRGSLLAVAWSADGHLLAAADDQGHVDVVDETGHVAASFVRPEPAFGIAFSPDGLAVATLHARDMATTVTELYPVRERWTQSSHRGGASAGIEWSPDGSAVTVAWGGALVLYAASDGTPHPLASESLGSPRSVRFDPGGGLVVTSDSESRFWGTRSPGTARQRLASIAEGELTVWSADGARIARARGSELDVLDATTGSLIVSRSIVTATAGADADGPKSEGHLIEALQCVGGRVAAVFDRRARVSIRDLSTGRELVRLEGAAGDAASLVADPAGRRLATGGPKGAVAVWDVDTGRRLLRRSSAQTPLRFSPDSHELAVTEGTLGVVIDAATGATLRALGALHPERAVDVAFSDGGEVLAAGGCVDPRGPPVTLEICVWDAQSGRERLRLGYHSSYEHPVSAAFSDDARWLAVAQPGAGEVELWDVPSRSQKGSLGSFWRPWLDGAYVRANDGRVDFGGHDRAKMETRVLCRLADAAVNFMACRERFLVAGLLPRILGEP